MLLGSPIQPVSVGGIRKHNSTVLSSQVAPDGRKNVQPVGPSTVPIAQASAMPPCFASICSLKAELQDCYPCGCPARNAFLTAMPFFTLPQPKPHPFDGILLELPHASGGLDRGEATVLIQSPGSRMSPTFRLYQGAEMMETVEKFLMSPQGKLLRMSFLRLVS